MFHLLLTLQVPNRGHSFQENPTWIKKYYLIFFNRNAHRGTFDLISTTRYPGPILISAKKENKQKNSSIITIFKLIS